MRTMTPRESVLAAVLLHGRDILDDDTMRRSKRYRQHGATDCYAHSVAVAYVSVALARRLNVRVDTRCLVRGALLHDYFLYDWHDPGGGHRLHAFFHAARALKNARRDFAITDVEADIICRHMFPVTPVPPRYRESVIVNLADKLCAVCECLLPAYFHLALRVIDERVARRRALPAR